MSTTVRLVRCPKCAKILREPTGVPLYSCGGCDTVLQAKYYRKEDDRTRLGSNEAVPDHRPSSDGQGSLHQIKASDQNTVESCNREQPGVEASVSKTSSPNHSLPVKTKESSQSSRAKADVGVESRERGVTENGDLVERLHRDTDCASEASSSTGPNQLRRHENSSRIVAAKGEWEPDVARNDRLDQTKVSLSASVDASSSSSNEATLFKSEELSRAAMPNGGEAARMVLNVGHGFKLEQQGVVGDDENSAHTEASSPLRAPSIFQNKESSGIGIESEEEQRRDRSKVENFPHEQGGVAKPSNQGPTTNNLSLQRKEPLNSGMLKKRLQYMVDNGKCERRDHVGNVAPSAVGTSRSQDEPTCRKTKESLQLAAPNKEIEGIVGVATESCNLLQIGPAKLPAEPVSSNESNHLDKESLASAMGDGEDGDVTVLYSPRNAKEQPKTNFGETGTVDWTYHHDDRAESSKIVHGEVVEPKYLPKSLTRQSLAYDGSVSSFDGHDDQVMYQQSLQLDKETLQGPNNVEYVVDGGLSWEDHVIMQRCSEIQQQANGSSATSSCQAIHAATITRASHPRRERRRSDGEFLSGYPFDLRNSNMANEASSSSNYVHDDEYHHHLAHPPPHSQYEDRRICPDVYWNEKEFPMYSNREASGEIYHDLVRRYSRGRQSGNSQQFYNYASRILYPEEAMAMPNMYPAHDPCLHRRHPEEVRWAPHLPPPLPAARFSRRLQHAAHASHRSWDPYESYVASPVNFMDHGSYGQDILSDDQRHADDMRRRLYLRRKNQPAQQYFRPMAGGAPFITCYLCSELLQLPSDFLLFKRRSHQLKCGACKRMLKFSLENGRYLVPYYVPNDVAKHRETVGSDAATKSMNPPGTLHPHQRVNSHRSSSGGGSWVNNNAGIAKRIPQTSSKGRDRESGRDELESSRSKGKNVVETEDAAASASIRSRHAKVTREDPPRSTSPLHRLMGYASPSQMLYASSDSEDLKRGREGERENRDQLTDF